MTMLGFSSQGEISEAAHKGSKGRFCRKAARTVHMRNR